MEEAVVGVAFVSTGAAAAIGSFVARGRGASENGLDTESRYISRQDERTRSASLGPSRVTAGASIGFSQQIEIV